jgi:hypothetical protein
MTSSEVGNFSLKHEGGFMVMYKLQFHKIYVHVLVTIGDYGNERSHLMQYREFLD